RRARSVNRSNMSVSFADSSCNLTLRCVCSAQRRRPPSMFRTTPVFAPGATTRPAQTRPLPCPPMRTRSLLLPSLAVSALLLSGCTSGADPVDPSPSQTKEDADGATSTVGAEEPPAAKGFLYRYIRPSVQQAVTGSAWSEPVQATGQDATTTWLCEARDGDEPLIRLAISRGAERPAEDRAAAQEAGIAEGGPDYLGEAYLAPRTVTALTMC